MNVIRSVTRNGRSIIFTAVLALILVYLFSIIGYVFFKDDFLVPVDNEIVPYENVPLCNDTADVTISQMGHSDRIDVCEKANPADVNGDGDGERKERACDSLVMCIVTTLNQGLRNGGGIGDILRAPSSNVSQSIQFYQLFIEIRPHIIPPLIVNIFLFILFFHVLISGSFVRSSCYLRFVILLHCYYYCVEFNFWCYH